MILLSVLIMAACFIFVGSHQAMGVIAYDVPKFVMSNSPTYVDGIFGQEIKVGEYEVPYYEFNNYDGLTPKYGTIEAWIKTYDWLSLINIL